MHFADVIHNVEVSELLSYVNGYVVIGHQVVMSDVILPTNLIDDEL